MATVREATHASLRAEMQAEIGEPGEMQAEIGETGEMQAEVQAEMRSPEGGDQAADSGGKGVKVLAKVPAKVAPQDVSKRVSEQWKGLTKEARADFETQAVRGRGRLRLTMAMLTMTMLTMALSSRRRLRRSRCTRPSARRRGWSPRGTGPRGRAMPGLPLTRCSRSACRG